MPPKFSLQSVLNIRHSRVEALEIGLGELLANHKKAEALLVSLQVQQNHLFEQLLDQQKAEMDLFKVTHIRSNIVTVDEQIRRAKMAVEELVKKILQRRQEIIIAKQAEEILDTLKNKEIERYMAEQTQVEGRSQDDIYIAQAYRARRQEG